MTSFAIELATPSVTDERTLRTLRKGHLTAFNIYCRDVCLCVCLSAWISPEQHTWSLTIFVRVSYVRGSILFRHVDDRPHRLSAGRGLRECTARAKCYDHLIVICKVLQICSGGPSNTL